jgi:hypothetical protein
MPNRSTDSLFQLIKSLKKSEKRSFKLYATKNSNSDDLKTVVLFDALDKLNEYDEELLLKKNPTIKKSQLSNVKAALNYQLLTSLRLLDNANNIDLQLHEQLDFARILYNKGLYLQSLQVLDKIKKLAYQYHQLPYLHQILFFEKQIESLHITRSLENRADELVTESNMVTQRVENSNILSNAALKLYGWYIKHGHARTQNDKDEVAQLFNRLMPINYVLSKDFYEQLYYYQSNSWYAFINQDFLGYYRHSQKWVGLFDTHTHMVEVEPTHYIKGVHNLLGAHFDLRNYKKFDELIIAFENFTNSDVCKQHSNIAIQSFVYLYISKLNRQFLLGEFTEGLALVPVIEAKLTEYEIYLDRHRILVFYYKIACLYFGSGNCSKAIDYLNNIINLKVDLRTDLQCYSRLLHLIAHYELGNYEIIEHLIKSVYRFMYKMENLSVIEEAIFNFIRNSFGLSQKDIRAALEALLANIKQYEYSKLESRTFMYLDIISWLESKLDGVPVELVIRQKYQQRLQQQMERITERE